MSKLARPIILSLLIIIVFGLLHVGPLADKVTGNRVFTRLNQVSENYLDDSLKKAAVTFALARTLNALISVLQESKVQATLFGAGFTIAIGQVLDPVNDLIERLSWVMMASMISLGIQKFAVTVGPWVALKILFSLALGATLFGLWAGGGLKRFFYDLAAKLALIAVMLVIFIPLAGLANQTVYRTFLEKRYQDNLKQVEKENLAPPSLGRGEGLLEQLKEMKLLERFRAIKEKMADYAEFIIDLSIVFVVQTIVLPLVTVWLFLVAIRYLTGKDLVTPFTRLIRGEISLGQGPAPAAPAAPGGTGGTGGGTAAKPGPKA